MAGPTGAAPVDPDRLSWRRARILRFSPAAPPLLSETVSRT